MALRTYSDKQESLSVDACRVSARRAASLVELFTCIEPQLVGIAAAVATTLVHIVGTAVQ